ncbi:MAG: transporter [Thermoproteota archaeon]|nr:transporter [Thermoproteota archaeon]
MAPADKRGRWYGMEGTVTAITRIPASILGGILWDHGFMREVIVIPIILELFAVYLC